jgi:hypothetical protein
MCGKKFQKTKRPHAAEGECPLRHAGHCCTHGEHIQDANDICAYEVCGRWREKGCGLHVADTRPINAHFVGGVASMAAHRLRHHAKVESRVHHTGVRGWRQEGAVRQVF